MAKKVKKTEPEGFIRERLNILNNIFSTFTENIQKDMNDFLKHADMYKQKGRSNISGIMDNVNIKSITSAVEKSFQDSVNKALLIMHVPTIDDLKRLEKKLNIIEKKLSKLDKS
ncbi:MAG: phasin family protein [Deltaproteobacteria bacterium]|nr:phasin family protein [Deltaproteobacteria bacterium]